VGAFAGVDAGAGDAAGDFVTVLEVAPDELAEVLPPLPLEVFPDDALEGSLAAPAFAAFAGSPAAHKAGLATNPEANKSAANLRIPHPPHSHGRLPCARELMGVRSMACEKRVNHALQPVGKNGGRCKCFVCFMQRILYGFHVDFSPL
jgi:hypothetical protein